MKRMHLAKLTLIGFMSFLPCASAQVAADRTADQTEILKAISEISKAYVSRDPEPFERFYLENYAGIRDKTVFNLREQLIAMMKADSVILRAGKRLDYDTIYYEAENPRFTFYGPVAVLNVAKKNYWQYHGQKCLTTTQTTEIWIKRDGEWKIAGGHVTTFQCDPKPYYPVHAAVAAVPAKNKAPANADMDAEQKIREIVSTLNRARSSGVDAFEAAVDRNTVSSFVATNPKGEIVHDRTSLETLPNLTARSPGLRSLDESVAIYDNAAIYTYRVKPGSAANSENVPLQCTIFFANVSGRWMIVGSHTSKVGAE